MFATCTRVDPADLGLETHYQYCRLNCGKINRVMHRAMLSFFRYAQELHGGEAALVLLYNPDRGQFRWHCPVQSVEMRWSFSRWVTSDYIAFRNPQVLPEGYVHFGDAHLHVGATPHPSGTDIRDDQDGLHIIVADIRRTPDYHVDFVIDGKRFGVKPEDIFEDPDCLPGPQPPRGWMKCVDVQRYVPYYWDEMPATKSSSRREDDDWWDRRPRWNSGNGEYRA
jgi:hypothetical protein